MLCYHHLTVSRPGQAEYGGTRMTNHSGF